MLNFIAIATKVTIWDGVMAKITHDHTIARDMTASLRSTLRAGIFLSEVSGWLLLAVHGYCYPIAGLVMLVVASCYGTSKRAALWLYILLLLATMIWGVWESGSTSGRSRRSDIPRCFRHLANIAVSSEHRFLPAAQ